MSHLGRWLSALVDGELEGEERDRVLNHVAGCEGCRQEANSMRALKRRLTALGDTSAEPAIAGRLIELARTSQPAGYDVGLSADGPPDVPSPSRAVSPRVRLLAASAGCALAAVGTMAFLLGSTGGQPAPRVTPSVDSYLMQHAYDAGQAPAGSAPPSAPASVPKQGTWNGVSLPGSFGQHEQQFGLGPAAISPSGSASGHAAASPAASPAAASSSPSPMVSQRPG